MTLWKSKCFWGQPCPSVVHHHLVYKACSAPCSWADGRQLGWKSNARFQEERETFLEEKRQLCKFLTGRGGSSREHTSSFFIQGQFSKKGWIQASLWEQHADEPTERNLMEMQFEFQTDKKEKRNCPSWPFPITSKILLQNFGNKMCSQMTSTLCSQIIPFILKFNSLFWR